MQRHESMGKSMMSRDLVKKHYSYELLPEFLSFVAVNSRTRWPAASCLLTSDVAWRLPGSRPEKNLCFWYQRDELIGYAWFDANGPCIIDQRSSMSWDEGLARAMLAWLESRRLTIKALVPWLIDIEYIEGWEQALTDGVHLAEGTDKFLQVAAFDTDVIKTKFLEDAGYASTQNFQFYLARSLKDELPTSSLKHNWQLRHVLLADIEARVSVHRASWVRSNYQTAQYLLLRENIVYEPELDIVLANDEGVFVSYCIGWVDYETGVGSFEPVGTTPEFRQQGLGRAVNLEGLRRMKAMGMHSAKIGTPGFNGRAYALYRSCGFELVDRDRTFIKRLPRSNG